MRASERNYELPWGAVLGLLIAGVVLTRPVPSAGGDTLPPDTPPTATPPRLRFIDGAVSFWRPGADDWVAAQVNTPMAAGDGLYASEGSNAEVEVAGQTFMRAGAESEVGLESVDSDCLQVKVTSGHMAFDLVRLQPGRRIEIDTPNAAFTVEQGGYYRVDIDGESTALVVRRGGQARIFPAVGDAVDVGVDQKATVVGTEAPKIDIEAVPSLDAWDRWNIERRRPAGKGGSRPESADGSSVSENAPPAAAPTEPPQPPPGNASPSPQYVSDEIAGTEDLDEAGDWRPAPGYGHVWVPRDVPPGWAPYTTGHWIFDPAYGWSWVDDAPWGWAPFHYGRWAMVDGRWAWVPGPVVAPVYAPALVAFLSNEDGGGGGSPDVGWVALGYGEPVIPWWGGAGTVGVAYWSGWGGPRIVNDEVINNTTVINVRNINITRYKNINVANAVVAVDRGHFGRAGAEVVHVARERAERLHPVRGHLEIKPSPASLVAGRVPARRPPDRVAARAVVATRAPQDPGSRLRAVGLGMRAGPSPAAVRVVSAPVRGHPGGHADAPSVPGAARGPGALALPRPAAAQHVSGREPRLYAPPPPRTGSGPGAPTRASVPPRPAWRPATSVRPATSPASVRRA